MKNIDYTKLEMHERIKVLRKNILNMSQEEFANAINISRGNMSNIEINRVKLTERVLSDISLKLGVSREWLESGSGDWRSEKEDTFIQDAYDLSGDKFVESFLRTYKKKTEKEKEILRSFIADLYNDMEK